MAKGASKSAVRNWNARRLSPVNTDDLEAATYAAEQRVRDPDQTAPLGPR